MSNKIKALIVVDSDDYSCNLIRWHNESVGKYGVAVSVVSPEGEEICHSRDSTVPITSQGALKAIKAARSLLRFIKDTAEGE